MKMIYLYLLSGNLLLLKMMGLPISWFWVLFPSLGPWALFGSIFLYLVISTELKARKLEKTGIYKNLLK